MSSMIGPWALWLASFALLSLFGGAAMLRLLLPLIPAVVLTAALLARHAARGLSVELSMREAGGKQQGVQGRLTAENPGWIPVVRLRCRLLLLNRLTGERSEQTVTLALPPGQTRDAPLTVWSPHCGRIAVSVERADALDCLGLTRHRIVCGAHTDATVLPETFEIRLLPTDDSLCPQETEEYDPTRRGSDVSEVYQIREYTQGDSLRQIHWKLTQKFRQLMVREPGQPMKRSLLLLLDLRGEKGRVPEPDRIDAAAEVLVSLSQALVEEGIAHTVAWEAADGLPARFTVRNADDLTDLLPGLLAAQSGESAIGAVDALLGSSDFSRVLLVCAAAAPPIAAQDGRVTALCCAEDKRTDAAPSNAAVILFGTKSYALDLGELMI
ncbi:MAG: DUF58 domain-containing protein [Oscillospiraceae bacterium]